MDKKKQGTAKQNIEIRVPDYSPSPRQKEFHDSTSFESLYGGAAGGGKTVALCAEAITQAFYTENTNVYIFRRTIKELKQSIYPEIMNQLGPYMSLNDKDKPIKINYNSQDSVFKFSNGSFIQLAYLDTVADRYRYMSSEIHILLIDELTHFYYDDYEYLRTRVRSGQDRKLSIKCATNPGNRGHGWVKDYFSLPNAVAWESVRTPILDHLGNDTGDTRLFIPAKVDDNPSETFRKSYIRTLEQISDENLRRAQMDGDWSVFQGQVFLEWRRNNPVIDYFPNDVDLYECTRLVGFDWGWRDPACAMFVAVAPPNEVGVRHVYVYREIYQNETTADEWAFQLKKEFDMDNFRYIVMPHDTFATRGGEKTVAQTFIEAGLPIRSANNQTKGARLNRQALLHQLLAISADGKPYLQVLRSCENLIRTVPDLTYDDVEGTFTEQIADYQEDHSYDSLTYALMVIKEGNALSVVHPGLPGNRLKAPVALDSGQIYDPQVNEMMVRAVKETIRPNRDWRYR